MMDASILSALMAKVLKGEKEFKIQFYLEAVRDALINMANDPQEQSYQKAFSESFKSLKSGMVSLDEVLSPGDRDRLSEIFTIKEFSQEIITEIAEAITENAATPAVLRDAVTKIAADRAKELANFQSLLNQLTYYHLTPEENGDDEAQVGFKLPREIFSNNFSSLIDELNFLKRFIRLVAEAEGGDPEGIEVGTISTTDPVFWLVVAYGVAKSIGSATTWCLDTWKKIEDIRNVRAQTAKLAAFKPEEIEAIFGAKIKEQVDKAIEKKVAEMTVSIEDKARKNEVKNGLRPALRQFLARVERGLTVDIRYLPRPAEKGDSDESLAEVSQKKTEIQEVASKLVFQRPEGEPILELEGPPVKAAA